ncbi:hypothetical protein SDC9_110089 [bioreactor metagenome]|uniref:Uncharacterized protein n=1 Tax=bioreactor metagenome TaxID=1076179 RepID=A0A645BCJ8_9ZZZZ
MRVGRTDDGWMARIAHEVAGHISAGLPAQRAQLSVPGHPATSAVMSQTRHRRLQPFQCAAAGRVECPPSRGGGGVRGERPSLLAARTQSSGQDSGTGMGMSRGEDHVVRQPSGLGDHVGEFPVDPDHIKSDDHLVTDSHRDSFGPGCQCRRRMISARCET